MSWVLSLKVYIISDSETSSFLLVKMKSGIETPFIVLFSTWGILFQQQHNSQMHFIRGNGFSVNVQEFEFPVSYLFEYLCNLCTISSVSCVLFWHVHSEPQPDLQYQKFWRWVSAIYVSASPWGNCLATKVWEPLL